MNNIYYADTGVLVKRHVAEIGSRWVRSEFDPAAGNVVITSKMNVVEGLSLLNRRRREAFLTDEDYRDITNDFIANTELEYQIIDFTDAVALESKRLFDKYLLRAGDAVQIASAIVSQNALAGRRLSPLIFLTSDKRVLSVAQDLALTCDDPQNYL